MEAAAPAPPPPQNSTPLKEKRKKIPTPRDLISHYEAQGMDSKEASVKVIEELQSLVMRVVSRKKSDKSMVDASRKIDGINARMAVVDMKLDSKPGVAQTFAIGVAAGAALQGLNAVVPRILDIWKAATSSTGSSSHPP